MDLNSITLIFAGFSFFCIGLILSSKVIKHLRFGNFVNLHELKNISKTYRIIVRSTCFGASLVLFGLAVWQSLESDRTIFWTIAGLGGLLVLVRIFAFSFGDISVFGFELEIDQEMAYRLGRYRSPFLLGGATLIIVFGVIPFSLDSILERRYSKKAELVYKEAQEFAIDNNFKERYIQRSIVLGKDPKRRSSITEENFAKIFHREKQFCVLIGKAGVGKTWFLKNFILNLDKQRLNATIVYFNVVDLTPGDSIVSDFNRKVFSRLSWYTKPLARKILMNTLFLLDGFDEMAYHSRQAVENALADFAEEFPSARMLVTTRPGAIGEQLKGFSVATLKEFSIDDYNTNIRCSRIRKLQKEIDKRNRTTDLDKHFVKMITPSSPPQLFCGSELAQIERWYQGFLDTYKLSEKAPSGERYAFLSTFRDMEILEEIFVNALYGTPCCEEQLIKAGKSTIYKYVLLQRAIRNCHLDAKEVSKANESLNYITEKAEYYYRKDPGLSSFLFESTVFQIRFYNTTLDRFVLQSELLHKWMEGEKCYLRFDNRTIDEYFISRVIKKRIDEHPDETIAYLAKDDFYTGTEVVPFLIGQYAEVKKIFNNLLKALGIKKSNSAELLSYLKRDLNTILVHIDRNEANYSYFKNLAAQKEFQELPKEAQDYIRLTIDSYLWKQ